MAITLAFQANDAVSTHSRPKAAADKKALENLVLSVSTHSRPKAAAAPAPVASAPAPVSTHSRPKAAAAKMLPGNY